MNKRIIIPYNPKLKKLARDLRNNMTLSEILLWGRLKNKQMMGLSFNRQRPIDEFIVDFYCKDLMLAIEIDGETHHHPEAQTRDIHRQRRLEALGIHFLRFEDIEVKQGMEDVLKSIQYWIEERGNIVQGREPTPYPS